MEIITYASKEPYITNGIELLDSAIKHGGFSSGRLYSPDDIDDAFMLKNTYIMSLSRGGGYWLWKPYIIDKHLKTMQNGEILCYSDSMYEFSGDFTSTVYDWLSDANVVITHNKPGDQTFPENNWTKGDIYKAFGFDTVPEDMKPQAWAGFVLLRKAPDSIKFIADWLSLCTDPQLITDSSSVSRNHHTFLENRHDQSLLSMLYRCKCNLNIVDSLAEHAGEQVRCVCNKNFKSMPSINYHFPKTIRYIRKTTTDEI